jgi:hypothetical protein
MSNSGNLIKERRLLCTRKKHVDVYLLPGGRQYGVEAEMNDGVHHIKIEMVVNEPSLKIKAISCDMLSVPDEICRSAMHCLDSMVGKRISQGLTRGMSQLAYKGCTHLVNLFHEACYNIALAQATRGKEALNQSFPGIKDEQLYKIFLWFKPDLKNSCVRYEENSELMQRIETATVPEGAESLKALAREMRN